MTHCNDQLIDQLLTQTEQEGRCLIPPSTAIRKALLRRAGGTVVSPMPGLFARKTRWDELNRAQRHCEIIRALAIIHPDWTFCSFSAACLLGLEVSWRHLNVVHVCSSTKPSARPGAHIQRHQIEPAGAIRRAGISVTPPIQTATDCLLQTGFADGMPIADSAISKLGLAREQLMEAVEQRATARNGRTIRTALTTLRYADACAESGIAAFTGDGTNPDVMTPSIRPSPYERTLPGNARRGNSRWASSTGSSNIPTRPCWPDAPPPRRSLPNDSARRTYRSTVTLCCALPSARSARQECSPKSYRRQASGRPRCRHGSTRWTCRSC